MIDPGDYLRETRDVGGWFHPEDIRLFCLIDGWQRSSGLAGNLLEVGAYHGKSTILMGQLRRDGEQLTVIDPWEQPIADEENAYEQRVEYPDLARATFERNYLRFHRSLPDIRHGLSADFLPDLPDRSFRFIHIDGSHEWRQVSFDTEQVIRLLVPGGIVAFDDMFVRHAPGVPATVWPATLNGQLVPFAITNKLYAQRSPASGIARLHDVIRDDPSLSSHAHTIGENSVFSVLYPPPSKSRLDPVRPFVPPIMLNERLIEVGRRVFQRRSRSQ